jgi:prepilin-type processing-associated H-X9-DG protein
MRSEAESPGGELAALGEPAREVLRRLEGGSTLTYRQTGGGCDFWFLDGSVIAAAGPWELLRLGLVASGEPLALTPRGREVAARLEPPSRGL